MSIAIGLGLGCGLMSIWFSGFPTQRAQRPHPLRRRLDAAGRRGTPVAVLVAGSAGLGLCVGALVLVLTSSVAVAAIFATAVLGLPTWALGPAAARRLRERRAKWPDVVDHLRSAVRAGVPLSEALAELGTNGPEPLRQPFRAYAADLRVGRNTDTALENLKTALADPVGDRLVAAVRLTREVGGADVSAMLTTLSGFLRSDIATRGELEARQSWTVNAARLAVVAPWLLLVILCLEPRVARAYDSPAGLGVLLTGLIVAVASYAIMIRAARLPDHARGT